MASLTLRNIVKEYPQGKQKLQVIHGVSAHVDDGQFVVIVGPSGCGKSTLLRMVAGLEEITSGEIAIGQRVVAPHHAHIAAVVQALIAQGRRQGILHAALRHFRQHLL